MTIKKYKGGYYLTFAGAKRLFVKDLNCTVDFIKSNIDKGFVVEVKTKTRKS